MSYNFSVACYRKDQYQLLLENAVDADSMDDTWEYWKKNKDKTIRRFKKQGMNCTEMEIDVNELIEYCRKNNKPNNGATRSEYVSWLSMLRNKQ